MVVIGDGAMQFTPTPAMERTQLRIFSGETELRVPIGAAFLRYHPIDRDDHISGTLTEEPVSASNLRRAQAIFEEEIGKSFGIELADLSRERWSLVPPVGDFLAEDPHQGPLRHAHLRALRRRGRGHLAVPARARAATSPSTPRRSA